MYMNLKPNKHKIISFNTTTMTSLGFIIVGGEGTTFLLLYSSIIFTVCEGKVRFPNYFLALQSFELAMQESEPSFYCTKT